MGKSAKPIKICIIDDHGVVRMGLKYMLSFVHDIVCVGESGKGAGAVEFVRSCRADVTLLDVRMPDVSGIEVLEHILSDDPTAKVIMLTTSDADEDIYRAIARGAKGYVLKESDPKRLLAAIRTVAGGGEAISDEIRKTYEMRAAERGLSAREREVLGYVARGLSNEDISKLLNISVNTVKVHLKSILKTMGVVDRTEAVFEGLRRGVIA